MVLYNNKSKPFNLTVAELGPQPPLSLLSLILHLPPSTMDPLAVTEPFAEVSALPEPPFPLLSVDPIHNSVAMGLEYDGGGVGVDVEAFRTHIHYFTAMVNEVSFFFSDFFSRFIGLVYFIRVCFYCSFIEAVGAEG